MFLRLAHIFLLALMGNYVAQVYAEEAKYDMRPIVIRVNDNGGSLPRDMMSHRLTRDMSPGEFIGGFTGSCLSTFFIHLIDCFVDVIKSCTDGKGKKAETSAKEAISDIPYMFMEKAIDRNEETHFRKNTVHKDNKDEEITIDLNKKHSHKKTIKTGPQPPKDQT
ncbi:uncharacterized protein BXIN_0031 [Babesia sp. Xinjiang]|uniref:uncharacterized protein n=1 Tax=Babesia sp. Xinjiang TaxID=462227 RepID=UPI000A255B3B|nr:uncharacterized protein BXIN_0031 [Babesia sp. Xinjiang]ORM39777.1 hypothetical protein BXIN_0031 [Babesia sp. Xinjiang]